MNRLDGYQLLHDGALVLNDISRNGIRIDTTYCKSTIGKLDTRIKGIKKKLVETKEYKTWKRVYDRKLNLGSDTQLAAVLFDHLKIEKPESNSRRSKKVQVRDSVDKTVLKQIDNPLPKAILELRRLDRANKRLGGILRETVRGYMHPFFPLNKARSYRGSSEAYNFQNNDVRDEEIAEYVRRAIIPRRGHVLFEIDNKGNEVRVSCCNHKDETMIADVLDPKRDMHRDMAMKCYMVPKAETSKQIRDCGKNLFVFPEFFGSYHVTVAKDMWEAIPRRKLILKSGLGMKAHLRSKGIRNHFAFEKHIKKVEHYFWYERYVDYTAWKEETWKKYLKKGYVDLLTGFRCSDVMDKKQALNRPIQGPAFHCLLWVLIKQQRWQRKKKLNSLLIGQIHDSSVWDADPKELEDVYAETERLTVEDIRKAWDWLILPLAVEAEVTGINESWWTKKDMEVTS